MTDGAPHPVLPSSALLALDAAESRRDARRLRAVLAEGESLMAIQRNGAIDYPRGLDAWITRERDDRDDERDHDPDGDRDEEEVGRR